MFGLLLALLSAECFKFSSVASRVFPLVVIDLSLELSILWTVTPVLFKLIGSPRDFVVVAFAGLPLGGVCNAGEEVASGLAGWAVPAHVLEVGLRLVGAAEEDLTAFVQDDGLVEEVVDGLRSLIDRHGMHSPSQVRVLFQGFNEGQRCR